MTTLSQYRTYLGLVREHGQPTLAARAIDVKPNTWIKEHRSTQRMQALWALEMLEAMRNTGSKSDTDTKTRRDGSKYDVLKPSRALTRIDTKAATWLLERHLPELYPRSEPVVLDANAAAGYAWLATAMNASKPAAIDVPGTSDKPAP